ncbi:hypothetical protein DVH26_06235 [Paenibacillus sp. H1-7]|nr:hypothetical protein DVH26_06235 [Paenibacillus sp. H1-7]
MAAAMDFFLVKKSFLHEGKFTLIESPISPEMLNGGVGLSLLTTPVFLWKTLKRPPLFTQNNRKTAMNLQKAGGSRLSRHPYRYCSFKSIRSDGICYHP